MHSQRLPRFFPERAGGRSRTLNAKSRFIRGAFRSVVEIARRGSRPDPATGHHTGYPRPVKEVHSAKNQSRCHVRNGWTLGPNLAATWRAAAIVSRTEKR